MFRTAHIGIFYTCSYTYFHIKFRADKNWRQLTRRLGVWSTDNDRRDFLVLSIGHRDHVMCHRWMSSCGAIWKILIMRKNLYLLSNLTRSFVMLWLRYCLMGAENVWGSHSNGVALHILKRQEKKLLKMEFIEKKIGLSLFEIAKWITLYYHPRLFFHLWQWRSSIFSTNKISLSQQAKLLKKFYHSIPLHFRWAHTHLQSLSIKHYANAICEQRFGTQF